MGFIQWLGVGLALLAILWAFLRYREKRLSLWAFLVWGSIWLAAIIVAVLPITTGLLAGLFGIGRGIDVAVYLSILLLFYLVFRLYMRLEDTRKEITALVRELARKKP